MTTEGRAGASEGFGFRSRASSVASRGLGLEGVPDRTRMGCRTRRIRIKLSATASGSSIGIA